MPRTRPRLLGSPPSGWSGALPLRQILGVVGLATAISATFVTGLWYFYQQSYRHLDDAFGLRLQNIAVTAAVTVPGDSLLVWSLSERVPPDLARLSARLSSVAVDNELAKIVLYQDDLILLDTFDLSRRGSVDPFLALDQSAVELARFGIPSSSDLQSDGDTFLKAGYAPVFDSYEAVAGFVGVLATAEFFQTLHRLRRTLLVVGATTIGFVVVLTFVYLGYARRLARARAALHRNETLSAMGRMASGIAHEIRNPLGIIKNTAQLLKEDLEDAGHDTSLVAFIPEEVDRLNETLTGYLEFAKDAPLRRTHEDLVGVLRRTLKVMGPDFDQADVTVRHNLAQVPKLMLPCDPRRMQQVFLNLLLNAIQAMPDGGELEVEVSADVAEVKVMVTDSGEGIEPARAEQVFDPFYTSKEKGSGLGLSVVRRIVDDHGGRIWVEPRSGAGARIVLTLPREAATN